MYVIPEIANAITLGFSSESRVSGDVAKFLVRFLDQMLFSYLLIDRIVIVVFLRNSA